MRLDRAVVQDVPDGEPALGERARHQEATMTIEWLAFRAHQADATLSILRSQPIKCDLKVGLSRHRLVVSDTVAIERSIPRAAAERFAAREISHAMLRQRRCQV